MWPGTKLRIIDAWQSPPAADINASHHNEGRAVSMSLSHPDGRPPSSAELGRLAVLAVEAGFNWVQLRRQDDGRLVTYGSVIPDGCRSALDLVLVLDGSGSIESTYWGGAPGYFKNKVRIHARV